MSSGEKTSRILEDPNAVKHMDALFEVVNLHSRSKKRADDRERRRSAAACVGPTVDDVDLLDALFAVIQSDPGGADHSTSSAGCRKGTKSWKERKLPPSFFNAGSDSDSHHEVNSVRTEPSAAQRAGEKPRRSSDETTLHARTQSTASGVINSAQPSTVLVADAPECLTFYIDKHLQCRVNLEPAVERRRRLARGRVQKYRSRNSKRGPSKRDTVHPHECTSENHM